MRIINLVDSVSPLNYGVWHAAVVNAGLLADKGFSVELWFPDAEFKQIKYVKSTALPATDIKYLKTLLNSGTLDPDNDIIVSHGLWQYGTRWGAWLKRQGFRWVSVPQGMLESWAMKQKWLKKRVYFSLVEKRMLETADVMRAVSLNEEKNLKIHFPGSKVVFVPNGVEIKDFCDQDFSTNQVIRFLFLSRLHHKKNIVSLVKAWIQSTLNSDRRFELVIAGPDQGELPQILELLKFSDNIKYAGAVFGAEKQTLYAESKFYVLPSYSEGLPSALLEAMSNGLVPLITEGCNFPDVFSKKLGEKITTDIDDIQRGLEACAKLHDQEVRRMSKGCKDLIAKHYSLEAITDLQVKTFLNL